MLISDRCGIIHEQNVMLLKCLWEDNDLEGENYQNQSIATHIFWYGKANLKALQAFHISVALANVTYHAWSNLRDAGVGHFHECNQ